MSIPDYIHLLPLPTPLPVGPVNAYLMDYFLALSEVLAHLDLLEAEGRVQAQMHADRVTWLRL
jgi:hypothetical protein